MKHFDTSMNSEMVEGGVEVIFKIYKYLLV